MASVGEGTVPERFVLLRHSLESSLSFVSPSLPMSRFKGRSWHTRGSNQQNEQDLEFC